ncbi:MAG: diacylglycerol kinase family protein [Bacilli bacterium]
MDSELRGKLKQKGLKRLFNSFKYAWEGIVYALKYEQNMLIHLLATVLVIILGLIVELSLVEWLFCLILIGLVIATELINSSLEAVVDLVSPNKNSLAKVAKDTASGAVLVLALTALIVGLIIFIPKIIILIGGNI